MNETEELIVEPVTKSDILSLRTWERPRSSEELLGFIARRKSVIGDLSEEYL